MRSPEAIALGSTDAALSLPTFDLVEGGGTAFNARGDAATRLTEEVSLIFLELHNPLMRYLLTLGLSTEDAEEISQDVFLALFRHLRGNGPRTNLRGWIFRVGHNLGLKRRQASARDVSLAADYATNGFVAADHAPDPEAEAVERQARQRLLSVWRALPEQDRRCLALRAEGLRYRDIASVLEMSLGSVALSLARSLNRLTQVARKH